jgi:type IV pilus assembly protein PilC
MSTFAFKAIDVAGVPSRGEVDADSLAQVSDELRERGLIVLDVEEQSEPMKLESMFSRFQSTSGRDMAVFARQFATLVASGMPMLRALYTLEDQSEDEKLAAAIAGVRQDVEAGTSLADAMERHPETFDKLFRSMVASGETSGRLDEALERVAFHLEKMDSLRRQIRSALMYPGFIFVLAIVIMLVIVTFIVPVFVGVFEELAADNPGETSDLPMLTQITVGISDFVKGYWFVWIPGTVASIVGFLKWKNSEIGRRQWDRLKLRLPAQVGDVVLKVGLARWSRTFAGTVSSGVPILQSIRITGETSGNTVIEEAMDEVYASVKGGGTIAHPIEKSGVFPPMVGHMVSVGEETGQLEHMMGKIADFYEDEVDAKVKALTSLLEPIMIVFVGGMVGVIVISMYLPIFSLYDKIK